MSDDELRLFERGEYVEHSDAAEGVEHAELPKPVVRERVASLTLSFESEEDRERLVELLELGRTDRPLVRRGVRWSCTWGYEARPDLFSGDAEDAS